MQLYNTLTRRKEPFEPITPGYVGIYFCGPTVYSEPHLGHARGPIFFDVVRRWFEHQGYTVRLVSNITDVGHLVGDADEGEDKLQKRAALEKLEPMEIAEKYFWAYFDALAKLGVRRPSVVPRASGHIVEQIALVEELLARGLAYERGGNVYFDVSAWEPYGELSGRKGDETLEGTRVTVRGDKDDPRDFALWKEAEGGHIMRWRSPWGEGYPGWHLECSVMSTKYLGDTFDIHGGGLDLLFPHHECELAQARGAGMPFARYWLHFNMVTLSGEKMAKSKGHFVTLERLFENHDPLAVRFHLLGVHYRSVSDFSAESLQASAQGLKRIRDAYREVLRRLPEDTPPGGSDPFGAYRQRFAESMNDDLNTPQALAVLFDATREVNAKLTGKPGPDYLSDYLADYLAFAKTFYEDLAGTVLGVLGDVEAQAAQADLKLLDGLLGLILEQRQEARTQRDFKTSDAIRDRLGELGVVLEDGAEGSRWKLS
ncbi:MAG: cysteine--tRNA ligase [Deinococcota bacterium]|nr:cysteine--tRNA ligase [Deinococcota bacterium]